MIITPPAKLRRQHRQRVREAVERQQANLAHDAALHAAEMERYQKSRHGLRKRSAQPRRFYGEHHQQTDSAWSSVPGRTTHIWTDGGCHPNPGPGAWAAIVRIPDMPQTELVGFEPVTTNNRMEMVGAVMALEYIEERSQIVVTSDSQYLVRGMTMWILLWKRRGWVTKTGGPVLNRDLWERLDAAASRHLVKWMWVRGHAGHIENEWCDTLASRALEEGKRRLRVARYS
jgi:ribonuclease HI